MSAAVIPLNPRATGGPKIMIVAVEPSADGLGAALMRELRALKPDAEFIGCGGPALAREGLQSLFPIEKLSVIGLTDALRAIPEAYKRAGELAEAAAREKIDAAVFIDAWAFSLICAKKFKKQAPQAKLFKFAAPQVWGSRPGRVRDVKKYFDGVLCLLPFEPQWFEKAGVKAEFVGNPNFQKAWAERGDANVFRERRGIPFAPILAVLLGSRKGEINRLKEPFGEAVKLLTDRIDGLRVVLPAAPEVEAATREAVKEWPGKPLIVGPDEKYNAIAAADAALAKSGTVTTEIAINRTPMAIAYRFDPLTAFWARRVLTTPFASVLNYAAGRYVIPEFIQNDCTPENLAGAILPMLQGGEARTEQLAEIPPLLAAMAVDGPPAAREAARRIVSWMADV